jgi:DNA-binding transcriptional MerR regulator
MQIFVSAKDIIKKYGIPYARINYLTRKGALKVVKKIGNKRLYSLEEIDKKIRSFQYRQ